MKNEKLKKKEIIILIITGLLLLWYIIFGSRLECNYVMWCDVYSVNGNEVQFIDETGNIWAIEDDMNQNYREDERVKVYFFDNHTPDRKDDEITKVKRISKLPDERLANDENT